MVVVDEVLCLVLVVGQGCCFGSDKCLVWLVDGMILLVVSVVWVCEVFVEVWVVVCVGEILVSLGLLV